MKIYTRTGDDGTTSLPGGKRVPKYDLRIEACGSMDELMSWIGLLRDFRENDSRRETTYLHPGPAYEMYGFAWGEGV